MLLVALGILAIRSASSAAAQETRVVSPQLSTIAGTVVSSDGVTPIPSAVVELVPLGSRSSRAMANSVSDLSGHYQLNSVGPGSYRLQVRRIGYAPTILEIEIVEGGPIRLSIALDRNPVRLSPVDVVANSSNTVGSLSWPVSEWERIESVEALKQAGMTSDVRDITATDVTEAVTLGGGDILRAVQMVPGISTKSDWTAELWTRGGRWDQTRVYFDGVPLFNPQHTFGMFTAISANSIGLVRVHPGARSAALGEGAAGLVEMRSASAAGLQDLRWTTTLSTYQGAAALRQPLQGGRGGLMLSGRTGDIGLRHDTPYGFGDIAGRIDFALGPTRLEGSWLWTDDEVRRFDDPRSVSATAKWNNAIGRLTARMPLGQTEISQTVAVGTAAAQALERRSNPLRLDGLSWPTDNSIRQVMVRGEVRARSGSLPSPWTAGYEVRSLSTHYFGSPTAPYAFQTFRDTLSYLDRVAVGAVWLETNWHPLSRMGIRAGLRLEGDRRQTRTSAIRVAPNVAGAVEVSDRVELSFGFSRDFQYAQALEGSGAIIGPGLQVSHIWLLSGAQVPLLQSDIGTIGGNIWLSPDWWAGITLYQRSMSGMVLPDPRPGYRELRYLFTDAKNVARGAEISLRRLTGRTTATLSYALAGSTIEAFGLKFPSSAERRHTLQAATRTRFNNKVLGGDVFASFATRIASGSPFTRILPCPPACGPSSGTAVSGGEGHPEQIIGPDFHAISAALRGSEELPTHRGSNEWVGEPNAWRTPAFWNVDAQVEWRREFSRVRVEFYMQMRNLLNRSNAVTYIRASQSACAGAGTGILSPYGDCFEPGIPFTTIFGLKLSQ